MRRSTQDQLCRPSIQQAERQMLASQMDRVGSGWLPGTSKEPIARVAECINDFYQAIQATRHAYTMSQAACSCTIGFDEWASAASRSGLDVELQERGISPMQSLLYAISRVSFSWTRLYNSNPVALCVVRDKIASKIAAFDPELCQFTCFAGSNRSGEISTAICKAYMTWWTSTPAVVAENGTAASVPEIRAAAIAARVQLWRHESEIAVEVLPEEFFFVSCLLDRNVEVLCGCTVFGMWLIWSVCTQRSL